MALVNVRTATITAKGQISIPRDLRDLDGFREGEKVAILAYEDRIEIRPMEDVKEKMSTAYASESVLAKDWDSKEEDETWKNL